MDTKAESLDGREPSGRLKHLTLDKTITLTALWVRAGDDRNHETSMKIYFKHFTKATPSHARTGQPRTLGRLGAVFGALAALIIGSNQSFAGPNGVRNMREFNRPGNLLIADQFNNRVIETDPSGNIVWSFGLGPNDFSAQSIIGVNDAQRVGPFTLMAGTGTPAGVIPQAPNGVADNRVMLVGSNGHIVWQYGQFGQTGSDANLLSTPVQSTFLPNFHVLITDQGNNRIIEVDFHKRIVWQYPGSNTNEADQLNSPNSAELLENGRILIADENNNRAIVVTRADKVVNHFTASGTLGACAFASRLPNGHTLLTDAGNSRAVEVDANDKVVWQYVTDGDPMSVASSAAHAGSALARGRHAD